MNQKGDVVQTTANGGRGGMGAGRAEGPQGGRGGGGGVAQRRG